jgi:hypothetical protein
VLVTALTVACVVQLCTPVVERGASAPVVRLYELVDIELTSGYLG